MTSNKPSKCAIAVMGLLIGLMAGCGTGSVTKDERDTLVKQCPGVEAGME